MKFKMIEEEHVRHTTKASDVMRQLAYAGIAAVWVVRPGSELSTLPAAYVLVAVLFGCALLFDALQYATQAVKWTRVAMKADAACTSEDDDFRIDQSIHRWPHRFLCMKGCFVLAGYVAYVSALVCEWA